MNSFKKITVGFVVQEYRKDESGRYVCCGQEFIAGDQVDYEEDSGNPISMPDHTYQPFYMILSDITEVADGIEAVLSGLDVGGEQTRQFAIEVGILRDLLKRLSTNGRENAIGLIESQLLEVCKTLVSYVSEMLYQMNDQVDLSEIEEIQQAKDLIERYYSKQ